MDTATPRTDAARISAWGEGGIEGGIGFTAVPTEFARELERELNAAIRDKSYVNMLLQDAERELASLRAEKEQAERLRELSAYSATKANERAERAERERDEAVSKMQRGWLEITESGINHYKQRAERAEAERDEAIRMRDRHAEASKAQNEDITALIKERDAAIKDAERYRHIESRVAAVDLGWMFTLTQVPTTTFGEAIDVAIAARKEPQ